MYKAECTLLYQYYSGGRRVERWVEGWRERRMDEMEVWYEENWMRRKTK